MNSQSFSQEVKRSHFMLDGSMNWTRQNIGKAGWHVLKVPFYLCLTTKPPFRNNLSSEKTLLNIYILCWHFMYVQVNLCKSLWRIAGIILGGNVPSNNQTCYAGLCLGHTTPPPPPQFLMPPEHNRLLLVCRQWKALHKGGGFEACAPMCLRGNLA